MPHIAPPATASWPVAGARWRPGPGALRLGLALAVLASHLSALNIGGPAVMLFFIISGYWVTAAQAASPAPAGLFVLGRVLRIYPMFVLASLFSLAVMAATGRPVPADPAAALWLPGLASGPRQLLSVAWSLDIELQFYLALPLLLGLARHVPPPSLWLLGGIAWGLGVALALDGVLSLLLFLPAFAAGMALQRTGWQPRPVEVGAGLGLALLAIGVAAVLMPGLIIKTHLVASVGEMVAQMLWALLLVPVLALVLRLPSGRGDRCAGDASFTLYLVHCPTIALVMALLPLTGLALKLVSLAAVALVSAALFRWVDQPLEAWRRALLLRPAIAG